jgi:ethanolamine transporter EutH
MQCQASVNQVKSVIAIRQIVIVLVNAQSVEITHMVTNVNIASLVLLVIQEEELKKIADQFIKTFHWKSTVNHHVKEISLVIAIVSQNLVDRSSRYVLLQLYHHVDKNVIHFQFRYNVQLVVQK